MLDTPQPPSSQGERLKIIGEVIASSTTEFTARASLYEPPPFGSFVSVAPPGLLASRDLDPFSMPSSPVGTVYALVHEATTGSMDSNRRPTAYGLGEEDLRREQPQIYELLATDFTCLIVGHSSSARILRFLPPLPPRIHAQVTSCVDWEIQALTDRLDYVRTLLDSSLPATDELIAASIRAAFKAHGCDDQFLIRAGKEIATLLHDDYARLDSIIRRITH